MQYHAVVSSWLSGLAYEECRTTSARVIVAGEWGVPRGVSASVRSNEPYGVRVPSHHSEPTMKESAAWS